VIDIQNITVQFAKKTVLNDISMTFEQGEMIGCTKWNRKIHIYECVDELCKANERESSI